MTVLTEKEARFYCNELVDLGMFRYIEETDEYKLMGGTYETIVEYYALAKINFVDDPKVEWVITAIVSMFAEKINNFTVNDKGVRIMIWMFSKMLFECLVDKTIDGVSYIYFISAYENQERKTLKVIKLQ